MTASGPGRAGGEGEERQGGLVGALSLGSVVFGLEPEAPCLFRHDPARSLHAALLRRLEALDPHLSRMLHDAPSGAHRVERPWTVSGLSGSLEADREGLLAPPGRRYWARVTALTGPVLEAVRRWRCSPSQGLFPEDRRPVPPLLPV